MYIIRQTAVFRAWLEAIRDAKGKARILARIRSAEHGNLGDVEAVGAGISEMRVHIGPGYRVYFTRIGGQIILLLCAGDKGSQRRDIEKARILADIWRKEPET